MLLLIGFGSIFNMDDIAVNEKGITVIISIIALFSTVGGSYLGAKVAGDNALLLYKSEQNARKNDMAKKIYYSVYTNVVRISDFYVRYNEYVKLADYVKPLELNPLNKSTFSNQYIDLLEVPINLDRIINSEEFIAIDTNLQDDIFLLWQQVRNLVWMLNKQDEKRQGYDVEEVSKQLFKVMETTKKVTSQLSRNFD